MFDLLIDIKSWGTSAPAGHVSGEMKYGNGLITVPVAGVYFVYCQVYHNLPNSAGRHRYV